VLPLEVDELTPEWFSAALGKSVTHVGLVDYHSGTTGRVHVTLAGEAGVPPSAFVKLAPFDERQRVFVTRIGMGVTEARFYRDLAHEIPVRVPGVFYAETDGDRYVMVLEDLVASGCRFPTPDDPDIDARALDIVTELATLHATYWESPRFADGGDLSWLARRGTGGGDGGAPFVRMAVDTLGDRLPPAFRQIADLYLAHGDAITKLWNQGPRTLVHGDPHLGNLFVDVANGNRTGFLDWAVLGCSPGLRDVAYVLCNSIPADVRAARERALVGHYCRLLDAAGVTVDLDAAWDQYRLFALYSWVAAASTAGMGSKWQPLHIGLGGTRRATAACEQLDCVGLVTSLL